MIFRATAHDGGLDFGSEFNKLRFKEWLKEHEGAKLRIEDIVPVRSMSQHRHYWVYMEAVSRETGHTPEEIHEWAKRKFLPPRYITVRGEEFLMPTSTTTLSKTEFGEYLDRICAEVGVPLPDPQEAGYIGNQ